MASTRQVRVLLGPIVCHHRELSTWKHPEAETSGVEIENHPLFVKTSEDRGWPDELRANSEAEVVENAV